MFNQFIKENSICAVSVIYIKPLKNVVSGHISPNTITDTSKYYAKHCITFLDFDIKFWTNTVVCSKYILNPNPKIMKSISI